MWEEAKEANMEGDRKPAETTMHGHSQNVELMLLLAPPPKK